MARDTKTAPLVTAILAVFGFALWPIAAVNAPVWFRVPFLSIWGLFVLALAAFTLDLWFYQSAIDASPREIVIRGGLLGIGRKRVYPTEEIDEFATATYGASSFSTLINVVAKLNGGKQITVAKRLSNHTTIQAVLDQLNRAIGRTNANPEG